MKYHAFCLCSFILLMGIFIFTIFFSKRFKEGMENNTITFTSDTGASAMLTTDTNGIKIITFTNTDGKQTTYTYSPKKNKTHTIKLTTYMGSNGGKAILIEGSNGMYMLEIFSPNGTLIVSLISTHPVDTANSDSSDSVSSSNSSSSIPSLPSYSSSYDNYNHYSGTSYPTIFYGPNGGTARVIQTDNNNTIVITYKNGVTEIYYIKNPNNSGTIDPTVNTYYGPNGASAKMVNTSNGKKAVSVTGPNGSTIVYTEDNVQNTTSSSASASASASTGEDDFDESQYYTPYRTESEPTMYPSTNTNTTDYSSSLPPGIPRRMIPPGQEDLYILKSEVVPPVCPVCPEPIIKCPNEIDPNKIPPCPPCARCPEPAFDCKKVPNYSAFNPDYMPVPALSDFSTFGM